MKVLSETYHNRCISCGRHIPEGREICLCCEKCNGYSAAYWMAKQLATNDDRKKTEKDKCQTK